MKTAKRDFIINDFIIGSKIKWCIIEGNNEDDLDSGNYLDKNGNFRLDGFYLEECHFNSRREAIGFLKSKFKDVNIVREIKPARYIEDDWEDDEEDYTFLDDDDYDDDF